MPPKDPLEDIRKRSQMLAGNQASNAYQTTLGEGHYNNTADPEEQRRAEIKMGGQVDRIAWRDNNPDLYKYKKGGKVSISKKAKTKPPVKKAVKKATTTTVKSKKSTSPTKKKK